jgi:hypothetical protein
MFDKNFIDLYDFLGIPPASPPNLVYLAILKIENALENFAEKKEPVEKLLALSRERLLNSSNNRTLYEQEWENYYFPRNSIQETEVEPCLARIAHSRLLKIGLKQKSSFMMNDKSEIPDHFNYRQDFNYLMMRDRPKERDVFFLDTNQLIHLPPFSDSIFFEEKQFCLRTYGEIKISITNDALGKNMVLNQKEVSIPLHIGDRMEFESGTRLILRGFYTRQLPAAENQEKTDCGIYFVQERVMIPLSKEKIYIVGRNTSDICSMLFNNENGEDIFCFINIGRRERSISRQNFQMFFRNNNWYIQDLGSRYGTTLDFYRHGKLETLAGGSIMPLESGRIRLGYDKSYVIFFDQVANLEEKARQPKPEVKITDNISVYNFAMF